MEEGSWWLLVPKGACKPRPTGQTKTQRIRGSSESGGHLSGVGQTRLVGFGSPDSLRQSENLSVCRILLFFSDQIKVTAIDSGTHLRPLPSASVVFRNFTAPESYHETVNRLELNYTGNLERLRQREPTGLEVYFLCHWIVRGKEKAASAK